MPGDRDLRTVEGEVSGALRHHRCFISAPAIRMGASRIFLGIYVDGGLHRSKLVDPPLH